MTAAGLEPKSTQMKPRAHPVTIIWELQISETESEFPSAFTRTLSIEYKQAEMINMGKAIRIT